MKDSFSSLEALIAGFQDIVGQILQFLPRAIAALLLLVLGWLLARLLRMLIVRAIGKLDLFWQRLISKRGLDYLQPRHPPTRVVGEMVFWLLMLIFISLAAEVLGLNLFGIWLKEVISYLPLAAAGLLIVLAGFIISSLVRDLVTSAAVSAGLSRGDLLGRSVQVVILFTAVVLGIDQIGIDIMFLSVMVGTVLAMMLGGVALAFGLGASNHVSNIIASNQLRQLYQVGDMVRINDIEGRVADITASRVILETDEGSVDVPAKLFDEQVTMILGKSDRNES